MKIGLIDVDSHNFPNLPLMKISAYHKSIGDSVEFVTPLCKYDIVYKSKIFAFSRDIDYIPQADKVIEGGTGYYTVRALPTQIEHTMPDYSLYPQYDAAYGFLTRGCPRNCTFCIVSQKEGHTSKRVADVNEFWTGQKTITLLDANLLACNDCEQILRQLSDTGANIDFTQGLDIRLAIDPEVVRLLQRCKIKTIHFAWDSPHEDLTEHFKIFKERSGFCNYRKLSVYVLTNFNSTHDEDIYRVVALRELGYSPFVMIYNKDSAPQKTRWLQRWVNNKRIFRTVLNFAEYNPVKKGVNQWHNNAGT